MANHSIPFSILDLAPVVSGGTAGEALRNSRDLARHAERWGYKRYWLAEHHNMTGVASAATSVVIGYVAGGTETIRVGSGGVMLPNHSPLVIAEQFGTLESLFPGRIDLGLGRAPGTDMVTARALRRDLQGAAESFPQDVLELQSYFYGPGPGESQRVQAIPGAGLEVPIWLLGSSLYSAQLAASLGLPFAFASHFAPDLLSPALEIYRAQFRPSSTLGEPYAMVAANVFAADTREEAELLLTSVQQQFINLRRGRPGPLLPPSKVDPGSWSLAERAGADHALACSFVGTPADVREGMQDFLARTQADELILAGQIFDHKARLRSFEIAAQVRDEIAAPAPAHATA